MCPYQPDHYPMHRVFVDSNLLVLLVAGHTDPAIIHRHKRLRTFGPEDFERLCEMLIGSRVLVTPNTLTEASNLLAQHRDPDRTKLLATLATLIRETREIVIASTDAVGHSSFRRLGLTDAGLLSLVSSTRPIITVDLDLYLAATAADSSSAVNYRHIQERFA